MLKLYSITISNKTLEKLDPWAAKDLMRWASTAFGNNTYVIHLPDRSGLKFFNGMPA